MTKLNFDVNLLILKVQWLLAFQIIHEVHHVPYISNGTVSALFCTVVFKELTVYKGNMNFFV